MFRKWENSETDRQVFYPAYERLYRQCLAAFGEKNRFDGVIAKGSEKKIYGRLASQISGHLSFWYTRCFIEEMNRLRLAHALDGENTAAGGLKTAEEQYIYFCEKYLKEDAYWAVLCRKYPVMAEILAEKVQQTAAYIQEVFRHFEKDRDEIGRRFFKDNRKLGIADMQLYLSDEHSGGKTTVKVITDGGRVVYYKPHSVINTVNYYRIYEMTAEGCGIEVKNNQILDCGSYGWEAEIKYLPCKTTQEVRLYYKRTGIQLCLAYMLGISDFHCENLIASGAYPVFCDLELFPDGRLCAAVQPESVAQLLQDSVCHSRILPGAAWGKAGADASALGRCEGQEAPFKLPVIRNRGKSDMYVDYEYPKLPAAQNTPGLGKELADHRAYAGEVMEGFESAWRWCAAHKPELEQMIRQMSWHSRYLFRNTQEYVMYQTVGTLPQLLESYDARRKIFSKMAQEMQCKEKYQKDILAYETACVSHGCIPVFYMEGRHLKSGNGQKMPCFFNMDAQTLILRKLEKLSDRDFRLQKKLAGAALGVKPEMHFHTLTPEAVADLIIDERQFYQNGAGWVTMLRGNNGSIFAAPAGMYLYEGLCGISLFMTALSLMREEEKYRQFSGTIVHSLFDYTDQLQTEASDRPMGLFTGEASFIFTYLILYCMTKDKLYLDYACRHGRFVTHNLEAIRENDFLDGRAGVIWVLLKLRDACMEAQYGTGERESRCFLESAEKLAGALTEAAVLLPEGMGWVLEGQTEPLAGMAHGGSGIAVAFAKLWQTTGKNEYLKVMEKTLACEDRLYDESLHNWKDIRSGQTGKIHDTVAWCHGAAGIMAARAAIWQYTGQNTLGEKISGIYQRTAGERKKDWCLCHGNMGLWACMNAARKIWERTGFSENTGVRLTKIQEKDIPDQRMPEFEDLSLEDIYCPGFMRGLSGIGYTMLRMEKGGENLPNIFEMF